MTGPTARLRPRYDEVSRSCSLFESPDSTVLRTEAVEQLWREHMLTHLCVDQQITQRAVFMAIGPKLRLPAKRVRISGLFFRWRGTV